MGSLKTWQKNGSSATKKCILACSWEVMDRPDHGTVCGRRRAYVRNGGNRTNCKYTLRVRVFDSNQATAEARQSLGCSCSRSIEQGNQSQVS
jgi:hypothetical protein